MFEKLSACSVRLCFGRKETRCMTSQLQMTNFYNVVFHPSTYSACMDWPRCRSKDVKHRPSCKVFKPVEHSKLSKPFTDQCMLSNTNSISIRIQDVIEYSEFRPERCLIARASLLNKTYEATGEINREKVPLELLLWLSMRATLPFISLPTSSLYCGHVTLDRQKHYHKSL